MKRIAAACLLQTIVFRQEEDAEADAAATLVWEEIARYKAALERSKTKYRITEESSQPDGSVLMKIMRQYNGYKTGEYLL